MSHLQLGLRANWRQFSLLVVINAFVGAVLGVERSVVPVLAVADFGITSASVTLSFIISFGIVKAVANLFTGWGADTFGRKRMLLIGWLFGLPVPWLIIWAPHWGWVVAANLLLGINQGLCWSAAVIMKIDLAGTRQRGLAMGLNEFAGYVAMSVSSMGAGYLASHIGERPWPFLMSSIFLICGFLLSVVFVRDTSPPSPSTLPPPWRHLFLHDDWLARLNTAGHINNLNDVIIWGFVPMRALTLGIPLTVSASVGALYLAVWGFGQLISGHLSDRVGRTPLISSGMVVQACGIALLASSTSPTTWYIAAAVMGAGTALVYPTLLAAVSDHAPPSRRATVVGVYRFWRDTGYAMGALCIGIIGDIITPMVAVWGIAVLTAWAGWRIQRARSTP